MRKRKRTQGPRKRRKSVETKWQPETGLLFPYLENVTWILCQSPICSNVHLRTNLNLLVFQTVSTRFLLFPLRLVLFFLTSYPGDLLIRKRTFIRLGLFNCKTHSLIPITCIGKKESIRGRHPPGEKVFAQSLALTSFSVCLLWLVSLGKTGKTSKGFGNQYARQIIIVASEYQLSSNSTYWLGRWNAVH